LFSAVLLVSSSSYNNLSNNIKDKHQDTVTSDDNEGSNQENKNKHKEDTQIKKRIKYH